MNLFLRVCGAFAAAAALVAGQQPLISIPVRTPSGPVHHFNLFEGDNILNAAEAFIASNDLQAANTNGQLRDSLVTEANARAVALRADVAAREEQAATAAAAAQDRLSISVDVNINVPFTYTEGQDAVEVARAFCTQHGLDEASNVPALIQLLRSKAAEEAQGREAAAQAAAAAAAAQREPLLKVPLTIGGNQVTINLYDGDVIADVAANVCSELNNNEVYPELVKVLTDRVRAM